MSVQQNGSCDVPKWIQLAGHHGSIQRSSHRTIIKLQPALSMEASFYKASLTDPISSITPLFVREFHNDNKHYIELEDLLQHFKEPNVLDVKMGTRTFLESETENWKERCDLYEKMVQVDPEEPSLEEKNKKKITKLRYMQFREKASSSATLGLRLEGIREAGKAATTIPKNCKSREQVTDILINTYAQRDRKLCERLLDRLLNIERCLLSSAVFKSHEMVGTSLLFLWDSSGKANIWMIDFAKVRAQGGMRHSVPWQKGNHEDGYLIGLRNLILIFEKFVLGTPL